MAVTLKMMGSRLVHILLSVKIRTIDLSQCLTMLGWSLTLQGGL